ncbi:MAG: hypothetical protein KBD29_02965 [Candidatus Magasanikbacteria bacterium]|nr:hypothetical protein [Candidatus Magasanikbacteria bacterium]
MILIGEHVTCKVEGYGEVSVEVQCFNHDYEIQGTCFEGVEVNEVENRKTMSRNGKVCGILYWNLDGHVLYPAAPPLPVSPDTKKVLSDVRAMISAYT